MKKYWFIFLFLLLVIKTAVCQEKEIKPNAIIYGDFTIGGSSVSCFGLGISGYYQKNNNLFSIRRLLSDCIFDDGSSYENPENHLSNYSENSFLLGKRFIKKWFSYSLLTGISHNNLEYHRNHFSSKRKKKHFIGLPYEIGFRFFKKEKSLFLKNIPIGRPTGFASSIGFKLYGNISQTSYIGFGITFGLGFHKYYY